MRGTASSHGCPGGRWHCGGCGGDGREGPAWGRGRRGGLYDIRGVCVWRRELWESAASSEYELISGNGVGWGGRYRIRVVSMKSDDLITETACCCCCRSISGCCQPPAGVMQCVAHKCDNDVFNEV